MHLTDICMIGLRSSNTAAVNRRVILYTCWQCFIHNKVSPVDFNMHHLQSIVMLLSLELQDGTQHIRSIYPSITSAKGPWLAFIGFTHTQTQTHIVTNIHLTTTGGDQPSVYVNASVLETLTCTEAWHLWLLFVKLSQDVWEEVKKSHVETLNILWFSLPCIWEQLDRKTLFQAHIVEQTRVGSWIMGISLRKPKCPTFTSAC